MSATYAASANIALSPRARSRARAKGFLRSARRTSASISPTQTSGSRFLPPGTCSPVPPVFDGIYIDVQRHRLRAHQRDDRRIDRGLEHRRRRQQSTDARRHAHLREHLRDWSIAARQLYRRRRAVSLRPPPTAGVIPPPHHRFPRAADPVTHHRRRSPRQRRDLSLDRSARRLVGQTTAVVHDDAPPSSTITVSKRQRGTLPGGQHVRSRCRRRRCPVDARSRRHPRHCGGQRNRHAHRGLRQRQRTDQLRVDRQLRDQDHDDQLALRNGVTATTTFRVTASNAAGYATPASIVWFHCRRRRLQHRPVSLARPQSRFRPADRTSRPAAACQQTAAHRQASRGPAALPTGTTKRSAFYARAMVLPDLRRRGRQCQQLNLSRRRVGRRSRAPASPPRAAAASPARRRAGRQRQHRPHGHVRGRRQRLRGRASFASSMNGNQCGFRRGASDDRVLGRREQRSGGSAPPLASDQNRHRLSPRSLDHRHGGPGISTASMGHYFLTAFPEGSGARRGKIAGWQRTGYSFPVEMNPVPGPNPCCRFFTRSGLRQKVRASRRTRARFER